jgi:putative membrane protein
MPIGFWELAILACVLGGPVLAGLVLAFYLITRNRSSSSRTQAEQTPLQILQERYARGEIDSEEFEERRSRILNNRDMES